MPKHTVEILAETLRGEKSPSGYMAHVDALVDGEQRIILATGHTFGFALENLKFEIGVHEKYGMSMSEAWADPRYHDELCGLRA